MLFCIHHSDFCNLMSWHIPREIQIHSRSAEVDADECEDDEGGEEEGCNEQHTFFGICLKDLVDAVIEQDERQGDDC